MPDRLATLRKAHKARRRADNTYRAALLAAYAHLVAAGDPHPYITLSRELGVARQVIRTSVIRATRSRSGME